jgi:hypothetical protein
VDLHSAAKRTQNLQLDYVVHHRRADGKSSPKVFKGWSLQLEAGERKQLRRQHSFRPISTRRYYPGTQRITLQINGEAVAEVSLELLDGAQLAN